MLKCIFVKKKSNMNFSSLANKIFLEATSDYHKFDNVDENMPEKYSAGSLEYDLYKKNWIDAVQWHLEDIIRNPEIDPLRALEIKRRIDKSNQDRTDIVERIDSYFYAKYKDVVVADDAVINTESPAWAIDRLSILVLKIWHMNIEASRKDASTVHIAKCREKLNVLQEQQKDLSSAIDMLLDDIENGRRYMKVYKQMKMYNDPSLNPILYNNK